MADSKNDATVPSAGDPVSTDGAPLQGADDVDTKGETDEKMSVNNPAEGDVKTESPSTANGDGKSFSAEKNEADRNGSSSLKKPDSQSEGSEKSKSSPVVDTGADAEMQDDTAAPTSTTNSDDKNNVVETEKSEETSPSTPNDPHVGKIVERNIMLSSGYVYPLQGKVISYQEPKGRWPPRWRVQYETTEDVILEDEWILSDLQESEGAAAATGGSKPLLLDTVEARYRQNLDHALESNNIVSTLLLLAALEAALQTTLQQQQLDPELSNTSTSKKGRNEPHPPMYYTTNPSSYLQPPTATDTTPSVAANNVQVTPAALAQRVRSGCEWAWNYLSSQQPPRSSSPAPPILLGSNDRVVQRRSTRQPKPVLSSTTGRGPSAPMLPTPVQQGGRVAMWWLKELENQAKNKTKKSPQAKANVEPQKEEKPKTEKSIPKATESVETGGKQRRGKTKEQSKDTAAEDLSDSPDSSKGGDDNDDEDFSAKDDDDDDEELEDVEMERGRLTPVRNSDDEEEEVEEESDDENDIMYQNPYLTPTFPAFLEYLARPRVLTGESVQTALCEAILRIRHNKRIAGHGLDTTTLESVDEFVLEQEAPNYPSGKVVLKCVSGESYADLKSLDPQVFSRCRFVLDVVSDREASLQSQRHQELLEQERIFKDRKAWDKWRYRGINEGFAKWPSWKEAIAKWVKKNVASVSPAAPAKAQPTDEVNSDEALAKKLEESEEAPTGRRRTRRAVNPASSDGVFYGTQSSLTQKQIMEALVRLVRVNQFQTLLGLQSLVTDDSSDPIRRSRAALGKLVWKRNELSRKEVTTDLSDSKVFEELKRGPLLTILNETDEDEAPPPLSKKEKGLVEYVKGLHYTELQLRKLVLKHLAEIPLPIIATAADERLTSMEAMDAADFDDQSSIEWLSTGHELIGKLIFRPEIVEGTTDMTECMWFRIRDYSKSVSSDTEESQEDEIVVERRMRFRAVAAAPPGADYQYEEGEPLLLTEAQVHAGLKAAEVEKRRMSGEEADGNPFAGGYGDKISLVPVDADETSVGASEITGRIVGHDNVVDEDDGTLEYRILVLPESDNDEKQEAFWATLDVRADDSSFICQPLVGSSVWYSIEHFDYNPGTEAFKECQQIIRYLNRQSKIGPFLEPVDPVALNIPHYHDVIKNPMDVSTLSEKLENGHYSSIPPGQANGRSPVSRMLNGPFRKDVELIFDNAMTFNPPDDWIHLAAVHVKNNVLKKIADASHAADQKLSVGRSRVRRSVYIDDESDVDMYEYESDQDDEYDGGRKKRKRKRGKGGGAKDEYSARAIENAIRLQATLREATDLRGPFANLPINMESASFTLSPTWSCRPAKAKAEVIESSDVSSQKRSQEIAELLALQKEVAASEAAGLRRSTRAQQEPAKRSNSQSFTAEYFMSNNEESNGIGSLTKFPSNRLEVEIYKEKSHEDYYAKFFQESSKFISSASGDAFGSYSNGSFPPYLGRVVPNGPEVSWEIRQPFVIPALRWVLRGLIQSGHVTELEPMVTNQSHGIIMTNDVYYCDDNLKPFEQLDLKELQRRKRANQEANDSESEDDIELSEYEKLRAQRVARNTERLKMLGLA
eukprot:scaffold584_cov132-Cylindrotheca_fusiformis.AAC.23